MDEIVGEMNSSESVTSMTSREVVLAIPILCFISLLMLVGTIGNLLVILTYCKRLSKSSTNLFIFCLAVLDLVSCCFVLSVEVYNILHPFTNHTKYLCSIQKYFMFSLDLSSGYIIVCISFDRYMRIARPHHGLSVCHAKISVTTVCILSLALCSVALFVYGPEVRTGPNDVILGYRCGTTQHAKGTILPLLFITMILSCFTIAVLVLFIVYIRLGLKVRRWNKERSAKENRQKTYFQPEESSSKWDRSPTEKNKQTETFTFPSVMETDLSGRSARAIIFKRPDYVRQISRSLDKYDFSKLDDAHNDGSRTLPFPKHNGARATRTIVRRASSRRSGIPSLSNLRKKIKLSKTTAMFIAATVAFVASHVPYVCVQVINVVRPELTEGMTHVELSLYRFAENSFILSYGVNPLIYSFMNPKFRTECRYLLVEIALTLKCRGQKFSLR